MPWSLATLDDLKEILANLYLDKASSLVLVADAGLDRTRIPQSDTSHTYWSNIVDYAVTQGAIDRLVARVRRDWDPEDPRCHRHAPLGELLERVYGPAGAGVVGYRLGRVISEDAGATIYEAEQLGLGRLVALKILKDARPSAKLVERFYRVAGKMGRLAGCRQIPTIYGHGETARGQPYLSMELLSAGETLASRLARGRLRVDEALRFFWPVVQALAFAHDRGVLHLSLKPRHVFLHSTEHEGVVPKVLGFGLAEGQHETLMSRAPGPYCLYLAPEQLVLDAEVDPRCDVHALAAIAYHMLAGVAPYQAPSWPEAMGLVCGPALPVPLTARVPNIPRSVDEVVLRGMAKDRAKRWASPNELYNELRQAFRLVVERPTPGRSFIGPSTLPIKTGKIYGPLWRQSPDSDEIALTAIINGERQSISLRIKPGEKTELLIGKVREGPGFRNDFALPSPAVSKRMAKIDVRGEGACRRVWLVRLPDTRNGIRVGSRFLRPGDEQSLSHCVSISIADWQGSFVDGRYTQRTVPPDTIDAQTGLLGREGLAWELRHALDLNGHARLLLLSPGDGPTGGEALTCNAALLIHAGNPARPVARFERRVGVLLDDGEDPLPLLQAVQKDAGIRFFAGTYEVRPPSEGAAARIEEAHSAMARLASARRGTVTDLEAFVLPVVEDAADFHRRAAASVQAGGQAALVVLEDAGELGADVVKSLEVEALQMLGRAAGEGALLSLPARGVIACAGPGAIAGAARHFASEWRARAPIANDAVRIGRSAFVEVIGPTDLADLARRAEVLRAGLRARTEGLPLPLARRVRVALDATDVADKAAALVSLVHGTVRFFAATVASLALRASGRRVALPSLPPPADHAWLSPWLPLATAHARGLERGSVRVDELLRPWLAEDGTIEPKVIAAIATASRLHRAEGARDRGAPLRESGAIDEAIETLLTQLDSSLRGWTLVHVDGCVRAGFALDTEVVSYVDYTGSWDRGTPRRVTIVGGLPVGRGMSLTRFAESTVIALDPFLRRRPCAGCGDEEIIWADDVIALPGAHRYTCGRTGHPLEDMVTAGELPPQQAARG